MKTIKIGKNEIESGRPGVVIGSHCIALGHSDSQRRTCAIGEYAYAVSSMNCGISTATGYGARAVSNGDESTATASGTSSLAHVSGSGSTARADGYECRAEAFGDRSVVYASDTRAQAVAYGIEGLVVVEGREATARIKRACSQVIAIGDKAAARADESPSCLQLVRADHIAKIEDPDEGCWYGLDPDGKPIKLGSGDAPVWPETKTDGEG